MTENLSEQPSTELTLIHFAVNLLKHEAWIYMSPGTEQQFTHPQKVVDSLWPLINL